MNLQVLCVDVQSQLKQLTRQDSLLGHISKLANLKKLELNPLRLGEGTSFELPGKALKLESMENLEDLALSEITCNSSSG